MSVAYLYDGDSNLIEMDVTTNVNLSRQARATQSSVMSKKAAADTLVVENPTVELVGIVSLNKRTAKNNTTTQDQQIPTPIVFQGYLDGLMEDQTIFTLYRDERLGKKMKNMVLVGYQINQGKYINTVNVRLSLQQIYITDAATKSTVISSDDEGDSTDTTESTSSSKSSGTTSSDTTYLRSWYNDAADGVKSFISYAKSHLGSTD